jgi:hypothetical protein
MALTPRRAALVVAAACALLAAAYLPPAARATREPYVPTAWTRAASELRQARNGLLVLEYRDSLLAALRRQPDSPLVAHVYAAGSFSDSATAVLRRRLGMLAAGAAPGGRRTGVAVIVNRPPGTSAGPHALPPVNEVIDQVINYIPPAVAGNDLCLTVASVTLHPRVAAPLTAWARFMARHDQDLLGPCWYVRAFGAPGPAVAAWIGHGAAAYAGRYSGDAPRRPRRAPALWLRYALGMEGQAPEPYNIWMPYEGLSLAEASCLNGRTARCADLFLQPLGPGGGRPWFWQSDVPEVVTLRWSRPPGPEGWLLSDLLGTEGPERFARFWRSSLPIDSAFADAFGTSPGDWTRRWAEARLGPPPYPPWPAGGDVLLTLAAVVVLAAAGGALRLLREIG